MTRQNAGGGCGNNENKVIKCLQNALFAESSDVNELDESRKESGRNHVAMMRIYHQSVYVGVNVRVQFDDQL
jgi:hypothetical protein